MKKILALAILAIAGFAHAASIDWKYTGTADDVGKTVYLFTSAVSDKYDTFGDLGAKSFTDGIVTSKKVGPKTSYLVATQSADSETLLKSTDTLYAVIISGADAKDYRYGTISTDGLVYDLSQQETSLGVLDVQGSVFTSAGTIGQAVPEPTSGLLLLLGMAGLALRRKQK